MEDICIMDQFDIQPYLGVGMLKFGMKKEEVEKILGPAESSKIMPYTKSEKEFRRENSLQLAYSVSDGKLVEISLYAYADISNVKLNNIEIFKIDGEEAMKYLIEADGNPFEDVGIILLLNLGISFGGFMRDDEPGEKGISVFARGRWDKHMDGIKPYKPKFRKQKK